MFLTINVYMAFQVKEDVEAPPDESEVEGLAEFEKLEKKIEAEK